MHFQYLLDAGDNACLTPKHVDYTFGLRVDCVVDKLANGVEHLQVFDAIFSQTLQMRVDQLKKRDLHLVVACQFRFQSQDELHFVSCAHAKVSQDPVGLKLHHFHFRCLVPKADDPSAQVDKLCLRADFI